MFVPWALGEWANSCRRRFEGDELGSFCRVSEMTRTCATTDTEMGSPVSSFRLVDTAIPAFFPQDVEFLMFLAIKRAKIAVNIKRMVQMGTHRNIKSVD